MNTDNYLQTARRLVAEQLGISVATVLPESKLIENLGADSLDDIELVMAFEEEYDIDIPDEDFETWITVQDIADYLQRRLSPSRTGWKPFFFESNQFFDTIKDMSGWDRLRAAYPDLCDADLLNAREATYNNTRLQSERDKHPNYGFRWEHDGSKRLKDFFRENNMEVEPRI